MDKRLIEQLVELAESFNRIGLKPVICGGLGIYLCFHKAQGQAIAEIITSELRYIAHEGREYLLFIKDNNQHLDVLAPPLEGFITDGFRIKIIRSKLHGHVTPEACFIEEGLRTVSLREFLPDDERQINLEVQVPSPTNLLLLKLFAFNDSVEGQRQDLERAQAHACDIYVTIMLTDREDYLEGQQFLSSHEDSNVIQTARMIVAGRFNQVEQAGWRRVLESSNFYPSLNRRGKEAMLDEARRRLIRWFHTEHR
jgi:hypothetical protein